MIFVVTGTTDRPFNRLILIVNELVSSGYITDEVIVQSGAFSGDAPSLTLIPYIDKEQFDTYFQEASLVIAHAGMGVIFTALNMNKPIMLIPRRRERGENVDNHQVETTIAIRQKIGVGVFETIDELKGLLAEERKCIFCGSEEQHSKVQLSAAIGEYIQTNSLLITASAGGHMVELLRLVDHIPSANITRIISTHESQKKSLEKRAPTIIIGECSRKTPIRVIKVFFQTAKLAKKLKPKLVLSTGALPSAFFCYHAHRQGADIVWVDSIASIRKLSMSGRFVKRFAKAHFTQWEDLADSKTHYKGNLL